jgi:hypothetical protein
MGHYNSQELANIAWAYAIAQQIDDKRYYEKVSVHHLVEEEGLIFRALGTSIERMMEHGLYFRDEYRPGIGREEWERICG